MNNPDTLAPAPNPYVAAGYPNRREYVRSLAEEYGVPLGHVVALAQMLGPNEDFDALVSSVQDLADEL